MWIILNKAFFSVVEDKKDPKILVVRARRPRDIPKTFPGVKVIETEDSDYKYRTFLPRETVAKAIADEVLKIDYTNFKGSVKNEELHDAYILIWRALRQLQK